MTADQDQDPHIEQSAKPKKPWTAPNLQRLNTADAEVGTRAAGDGAFTTS